MINNPVFDAAFRRAALHGCLLGALAFMGARQQGLDWENSVYAFLGALVALLISRGAVEGGYDNRRAQNNNVNAGDVPMAAAGITVTKP
jgi:hypothetical protein